MIGFFYLTGFLLYIFCVLLFTFFYYKGRAAKQKIRALVFFAIFLLVPFSDLILQFFFIQARAVMSPPLQQVRIRVEFPGSAYWEDNVWPGFDEFGRNWMVKNYLDGKHLQALAMNGDDGLIYLYRYNREGFEIYKDRNALPALNYHVVFEKLPLHFFEQPFLWADQVKVISNKNNDMIAWSKRYCGYGWWLGYHPVGDFARGYVKGDVEVYEFDDKVLFEFGGVKGNLDRIKNSFRRRQYRLLAINWEKTHKGTF